MLLVLREGGEDRGTEVVESMSTGEASQLSSERALLLLLLEEEEAVELARSTVASLVAGVFQALSFQSSATSTSLLRLTAADRLLLLLSACCTAIAAVEEERGGEGEKAEGYLLRCEEEEGG
jgi:hypothetical protein